MTRHSGSPARPWLPAGVVSLCLALTVSGAAPARAASFLVDSTADALDAAPGNGTCATAGGVCTLRAALGEADALAGMDVVTVPAGVFLFTLGELVVRDSVQVTGAGKDATFLDAGEESRVLTVDHRQALVCDSPADRVLLYDLRGDLDDVFVNPGAGGLGLPGSVAFSTDEETMWVTGFSTGVHRYDGQSGASGELFIALGSGGLTAPADVERSETGLGLFVADYSFGGGILRYDEDTGAFLEDFIPAGTGGLDFPNSILVDFDELYVTSANSNEVLRYDAETGAFLDDFVPAGSGGLDTPRGIVRGGTAQDFDFFVASEGNDRVIRYDAVTGAFLGNFVAPGSGGLDGPTDVDFGPDGDLYVVSRHTGQVLQYDGATGAFQGVFIDDGDGGLDFPACFRFVPGRGFGPIVTFQQMTLRNGVEDETGASAGGVLVNRNTTFQFIDAVLRDCRAQTFGAGLQIAGHVLLRRVEVRGNEIDTGLTGGGQTSTGGGMFVWQTGVVDIEDSAITENRANRGGGIANNGGDIDILNTTISGNSVYQNGGGIRNVGGHIDISFCTITENEARAPGGEGPELKVGGGIYNSTDGQINMANTILAGNTNNLTSFHDEFAPDCYSTDEFRFTSHRDNLVGVLNDLCRLGDTIFGEPPGFDDFGTEDDPLDPLLSFLAQWGGPTRNHQPGPASPAIDRDVAGTSATFFDCDDHDQRGTPRPLDGDVNGTARCDVGAHEWIPPDDADGVPGPIEAGAPNDGDGNADGIPDEWQPGVTSLPNAVDGQYVTFAVPDGHLIQDVAATPNPAPATTPPGVAFPVGHFSFTATTVAGAVEVTLFLPPDLGVDRFLKFGRTPLDGAPHWYEFAADGLTGALFAPDQVDLDFGDGQRGDDDLAADGAVTDPGAPARTEPVPIDVRPHAKHAFVGRHGVIPVAILSYGTFAPVQRVDRASLTFGRTGDEPSLVKTPIFGIPLCHGAHVDHDGRADLVCLFRASGAAFQAGDTEGVLKGADVDGFPFSGTDAVVPLPWL